MLHHNIRNAQPSAVVTFNSTKYLKDIKETLYFVIGRSNHFIHSTIFVQHYIFTEGGRYSSTSDSTIFVVVWSRPPYPMAYKHLVPDFVDLISTTSKLSSLVTKCREVAVILWKRCFKGGNDKSWRCSFHTLHWVRVYTILLCHTSLKTTHDRWSSPWLLCLTLIDHVMCWVNIKFVIFTNLLSPVQI